MKEDIRVEKRGEEGDFRGGKGLGGLNRRESG